MIYVTGDTHGLHDFDKLMWFSILHPKLDKNDFVIVCGDFGGIWADDTENALDSFSSLPFTILFVDGNHENYDRLGAYPVSEWNGGKVQIIRSDIIHLMRGQVFRIDGKTFFTFGGAESHDKENRKYGESIWYEEVPCIDEIIEAENNLERVKWNVDYVITHSCDTYSLLPPMIPFSRCEEMKENGILDEFEERLNYRHWYFGHYHRDENINDRKTLLFQQVIPIGESAEK